MTGSTRTPSQSRPTGASEGPAASPAQGAWQVRLLGEVEARSPEGVVTRVPWRAAALLLARLALAPQRMHPREELIELLWPGVALDVGRNRLRQALSTVKTLLQEEALGPVILADRSGLRVAPGALACDALLFERHLRAGEWDRADALYRGELMPGFYDEWVLDERRRFAELAERLQAMPRVSAPPPVAPAAPALPPGQFPAYWTRLFGIEINASRLRELVSHQRLVTVTGAGGSGKTRLAVEAARSLTQPKAWSPALAEPAPSFGFVRFVSLIDRLTAAHALDAVAAALQVQGRDPMAGIASALAGQTALLVLDNFEQLVGPGDALVRQLLTDVPGLHLLITSRLRLGVEGEQVFELAGLPVPDATQLNEDPNAAVAVALFVDRARAVAPDFDASARSTPAIGELVRLLSGMPLAIELAASRMRALTPQDLLATLTEGRTSMLDVLARDGLAQGQAQRHASMRHVVAWSWSQLGPGLVPLMQAMAAFGAPARADTVAAVAALALPGARLRLEQLRDHSLLVAQRDAAGGSRYVLLQPVREFVAERTEPAVAAQARDRLRRWLIAFGEQQAARGLAGLHEIEAEMPQLQAAIVAAAADGPAAQVQAVRLAVALRRHWEIDTRAGLPLVVIQALQAALPAVDDPGLRCECSVLLAFSCVLAGLSTEARTHAAEAVALAADPRRRAHALLRHVQVVLFSHGDASSADVSLAQALALAQEAGDLEAQALALRMQFLVAVNRDGDRVRGEALATQVQALWEQLGHRRNAYSGLMDRASCWLSAGRFDEAATALAACEQAARQDGYATGHIMSSWQLGRAELKLRRADQALAAFRRCLQGSWEHKRLAYVADALVLLPGGLAFAGRPEAAARLMGFAVQHWQRHFGAFYRELDRDVCATRRWLRQRLGPVRMEALRLEGACLSLPEAVALGLDDTQT